VTLIWTVPVVAAAVATLLVVGRARALEQEVVGVLDEARRLREVGGALAAVRAATAESGEVVAEFRRRHPLDDG
jgi:hypothetical protein